MRSPAFVSYARPDSEFVLRLAEDLKASGANIWLDQLELKPGLRWDREIQRALETCEQVLLILSPAAVVSDNVMDELAFALKKRKVVVPVLYRDCELPYRIERIHYIDMRKRDEKALRAVLAALGRNKPGAPSAAVGGVESRVIPPDKLMPALPRRAGDTHLNPKDGLTYVWIPPGTFVMGCSQGDNECNEDEKPSHQVTITRGFWLGQTPVTQEAYERVMGNNPSRFSGARLPVDNVSWYDAQAYCRAIGARLPTEAEWEYAARAGSRAARYGEVDSIAWYRENSGSKAHEVGLKQPNAFGLYDTLGNVWEWVEDWYAFYTPEAAVDPKGSTEGKARVMRGGAWYTGATDLRAANRYGCDPENWPIVIGLRCAKN